MAEYNVLLLDKDGYEIISSLVDGLPAAKKQAQYCLSDAYAKYLGAGSTHEDWGTDRAQVRNDRDECVWEAVYEAPAMKNDGIHP